MVGLLIKEGKADVDKVENDGGSPLYVAAQQGFTEIVKFLLTEGKAEVDKTNNLTPDLHVLHNVM